MAEMAFEREPRIWKRREERIWKFKKWKKRKNEPLIQVGQQVDLEVFLEEMIAVTITDHILKDSLRKVCLEGYFETFMVKNIKSGFVIFENVFQRERQKPEDSYFWI